MQRLKGKICLVTGAARGIGEAIVRAFHDEGARVIVTDIDEGAARSLAAELDTESFRLDVAEEADWDAMAQVLPVLDVLVNNAGITGFESGPAAHDPEHATLADWRAVHAVNSDGTFLGCRYAIRAMRAAGAA